MPKLCKRGKIEADEKFGDKTSAYKSAYGVKVCTGKVKGAEGKKRNDYGKTKKNDGGLSKALKRLRNVGKS